MAAAEGVGLGGLAGWLAGQAGKFMSPAAPVSAVGLDKPALAI